MSVRLQQLVSAGDDVVSNDFGADPALIERLEMNMTRHQRRIGRPSRLRNRAFWSSVLAPLVMATGVAKGKSNADEGAPLPEAALQRDLDDVVAGGAPGAILYVRNGEHEATLTAGVGDLATGVAMRADDHIKIASLTKTYVATALPEAVAERFTNLLVDAFCSTAPAGDAG